MQRLATFFVSLVIAFAVCQSAHAVAGALKLGQEMGPDAIILVNLSGRGDKDVDTAAEWFGLVDARGEAKVDDEKGEPA